MPSKEDWNEDREMEQKSTKCNTEWKGMEWHGIAWHMDMHCKKLCNQKSDRIVRDGESVYISM